MPVSTLNTDILTASLGKPVALAYGRHVVAGNVILQDETDPDRTTVFIALGEGEWDAIEELFVNGAEADLEDASLFHFHKGLDGELSTGGTLDPEGVGSPFPFSVDGDQKADLFTPEGIQGLTFSRTAYLALSVPYDAFAPTAQVDVRGVFRTRKVRIFDSAGVQTGYQYSDNPAWQIADLLTVVRGFSDSRLDWASLVAAAAYCDQLITPVPGGPQSKRFVSHVAFTETVDFDQALVALLSTCRGVLLDTEGSIKLRIDQTRSPLFDFTMDNIVEGTFSAWFKDTREVANRLELLFRDLDNNFAITTKLWNHEPQQARTDRVIPAKLALGNVAQHQAERIGNYLLTRAIDNNLFCSLRATAASLTVMPGDVVRVAHDAAPWGQQTFGDFRFQAFEVLEVTENPDETREFLCRVYNPNTYPDTAGPAQNLIGTTLRKRPLPPPAPQAANKFSLTANLGGDLRLSFDIPLAADYRTGDLRLVADLEKERISTTLAADVGVSDTQIQVASSVGFRVGDYVDFATEIVKITGPGNTGEEPTSTTWDVDRAQKLTTAGTAVTGNLVCRLSEVPIHFAFPPGYTLAHPTLDLANGEYYVLRLRPGRMRVLHASLAFTGPGGISPALEKSFDAFAFEPIVPNTLPGLRVADGGYGLIEVLGDLPVAGQVAAPLLVIDSATIGIIYAAVDPETGTPEGASILGQLTIRAPGIGDGESFFDLGSQFEIPDGQNGTGVFFSGAQLGNIAGADIRLEIVQVGSLVPGRDLRVYITF